MVMENASFFDLARNRFRAGLAELDQKWGWYLALGVFLVVLGMFATGAAVATTLFTVVMLGWVLLGSGVALAVLSFLTGKWSGFLLTLAAGVLSIIAGFAVLSNPISGAVAITLMVGFMLVVAGIFRAVASLVMQFPHWGWSVLSGIVEFVLGVMVLQNWQTTSLWFLGLAVGIDLIFHGFAWIMFSLRVHSLAGEMRIADADRRAA